MQRTFKNRYDLHSSMPYVLAKMSWTLLVFVMVFQQIKTTDAVKFKGDGCISKNQPGICKEWSECPIIKTLIESGQYTNREVVSCGFGVREELICCPELRGNPTTETSTSTNFVVTETTTQAAARDFWLDLIENTTSSTAATPTTTAKPDFWLDLLTSTTTETTTLKPLIVGDQRLNESSEFFDLNALLSGKHSGGPKQERHATTVRSVTNSNSNSGGFVNNDQQGNGRRNLNSGPVNLNQWSFDESSSSNNNFRQNGNNGRGQGNNVWNQNTGRGQGNGWSQNNGRGQGNSWGLNNGRGQANTWGLNNGRAPQNNGRGRPVLGNQNRSFQFPDNSAKPNQFFETDLPNNRKTFGPVNTMTEQNPNFNNANFQPISTLSPSILPQNNDDNKKKEEEVMEELIKNVFDTNPHINNEDPVAANNQPLVANVEETIASVFNLKPQQQTTNSNAFNREPLVQPGNTSPVTWLTPQVSTPQPVEYIQLNPPLTQTQPQQHPFQVAFQNPHMTGHFEVMPTVAHPINSNDLEAAPSTSFIQQPVVVETWSNNPTQVVYENLLNAGIDIVKSQEMQHQQQQQFLQSQFQSQPQVIVVQPHPQQQQQVFFQQPQHLIQQPSQSLIDPRPQQSESLMKESRSTSPALQPTNTGLVPNIQSPPAQILDPFKPFEFRPSPANANLFSEDNNSLSPNPTPTTRGASGDRPAVRACRRIEQGLNPTLSPHILGGTPAELGEFPHMVAIGYSRIGGDNRPPYDIRCGGTLIDKRFVLTAAHCVSDRESVPTIVRLGVVNFTDPEQMSQAVELRIKETFIHDSYSTRLTYNDIAILELEREIETSEYIYPVCLYTNETDLPTGQKVWVTGWGTVNTTTRSFSDILLKAPLYTSPLESCNRSFTEYGLNRRIPEGIIGTQLCAGDKGQVKDACQGDSGGPLNLIIDESLKNYRLVGIVSSGFGCASSTPGLYTRVAAFLDFIEKIVWPNGGD